MAVRVVVSRVHTQPVNICHAQAEHQRIVLRLRTVLHLQYGELGQVIAEEIIQRVLASEVRVRDDGQHRAARTHITEFDGHLVCQRLLQRAAVLPGVRRIAVLRIHRVDRGGLRSSLICSAVSGIRGVNGRISEASNTLELAQDGLGIALHQGTGAVEHQLRVLVRRTLVIELACTNADDSFASAKRVPCDTDPRSKIVFVRLSESVIRSDRWAAVRSREGEARSPAVVGGGAIARVSERIYHAGVTKLHQAVSVRIKVPERIVRLIRNREVLIADANVQSPTWMEAPRVLRVEAYNVRIQVRRVLIRLPNGKIERRSCKVGRVRVLGELADVRGVDKAARGDAIAEIILQTPVLKAELQSVTSMGPGKIVCDGQVGVHTAAWRTEWSADTRIWEQVIERGALHAGAGAIAAKSAGGAETRATVLSVNAGQQ